MFKYYVTDLLKCVTEYCGADVARRYYDIVNVSRNDTQTGDEIAVGVIKRAGLKLKESDNESA